jgi:hypothetical protein
MTWALIIPRNIFFRIRDDHKFFTNIIESLYVILIKEQYIFFTSKKHFIGKRKWM